MLPFFARIMGMGREAGGAGEAASMEAKKQVRLLRENPAVDAFLEKNPQDASLLEDGLRRFFEQSAKTPTPEQVQRKIDELTEKLMGEEAPLPEAVGQVIPAFGELVTQDAQAVAAFSQPYLDAAMSEQMRETLRKQPGGLYGQMETIQKQEIEPILLDLAGEVRDGAKTDEQADAELRARMADIVSKYENLSREETVSERKIVHQPPEDQMRKAA